MQGVGSQVIALIIPLVVITGISAYAFRQNLKKIYRSIHRYIFGDQLAAPQPVARQPLFGAGQCSICLDEPKKFEITATCGHSYCCECIFTIYERTHQKVACPLCRQPITTMFKTFREDELPAETRVQMQTKIRQYNARFDDNRPLIRRIMEFPHVLRGAVRYMGDPRFWILFLKSLHFFRVILLAIFYLLLPVDLVPQRLFGFVGFIDDIFIFITFACIGLALFAPIFIRARQH